MRQGKRWLLVLFGMVILFGIVIVIGCEKSVPRAGMSPNPAEVPSGMLKGVSLSPRSFQAADFTDFFEKAKETGQVVSWAGDWNELDITKHGAPIVVTELASNYGYTPVVEVQFFDQSSGNLLRPLDETTRESYKNYAVSFASKYKPKYLVFGIEVNVLYEKSPDAFEHFVLIYTEIYDEVKAVSPKTKVFTVFQLEKMKGLNGGLFGGTNDPDTAQWNLLNKLPKCDIIAFTTYPSLIYKSPSEIPTDYYAEIKSKTEKRIAFTEIGWHSNASPAGWESNDAEQSEFVARFFNLSQGLDKEMVIWSFMYDQNTIEPFNSMGLRRADGGAKLAWDEWVRDR